MITQQQQKQAQVTERTYFDEASSAYDRAKDDILAFGYWMAKAIDQEGRTLREMSIEKCGTPDLEDRMGRWVQAARWHEVIQDHPLANDAAEWLSTSHLTELYKIATDKDTQTAMDAMEECFVRNLRKEVTEVKPVDWLRAKRKPSDPTTAELFHRFWMFATKVLPEAYSVLERMGKDASKQDRRRVRVMKLVVSLFKASDK